MIYCPLYFWINLWILLLFYKLHLWSFFLEKHEKHNCCNPLKLLPDDFWHLKKCSVLPTVRWEDQYHQNVLENDQTSHVILIKKANEGIYHSNVKSLEMMCQTDVCLSWKALDVKLFQNYPPPPKKIPTKIKNKYYFMWLLMNHKSYWRASDIQDRGSFSLPSHHNNSNLKLEFIKHTRTHTHVYRRCIQQWPSGGVCIIHQDWGVSVWSVCGLVGKQLCVAWHAFALLAQR